MAISTIQNVFEETNQSAKWAFGKRCRSFNDVPNDGLHLDLNKSPATYVIGIRLADLFPLGMIDIATLVPGGHDFRVVGPHDGSRVRRQDRHKITILYAPQEATDPQERQVQQLNYDTFICTMASIFEKYGTDILM